MPTGNLRSALSMYIRNMTLFIRFRLKKSRLALPHGCLTLLVVVATLVLLKLPIVIAQETPSNPLPGLGGLPTPTSDTTADTPPPPSQALPGHETISLHGHESATGTLDITLYPKVEGIAVITKPITITFVDTTNTTREQFTITPHNNRIVRPFTLPSGTYDIEIHAPGFLRRKLRAARLEQGAAFILPKLFAGDFNGDGVGDGRDWSRMARSWHKMNDIAVDINADGIINSLDFSFVNRNWGRRAEE